MSESRAAAFERVFRADHVALVAFCYRRVEDYELARDLTAETFRIAWQRWEEPRRSDRAWLFGVARNLIGNEYTRRRSPQPVSIHGYPSHVEPRDDRADAGFDAIEVRAAVTALEPIHQEVLQLTYWDGLSAADAAQTLGITTAAVWVRLTRARRAFALAWQDNTTHSRTASTRTTS